MSILSHKTKYNSLVTFFGLTLVLIGVFATARVALNLAMDMSRYPTTGVLPNFVVSVNPYPQPYPQREEDCKVNQVYYAMDGMGMRTPSEQEKKLEVENEDRCLANVKLARESAKMADINLAAFLLFIGFGLLLSRPFFFKAE
jgi:hypothetical protein